MKTQHTHSYTAGLFVGEGSISVTRKVTDKGYIRHVLTCCLSNTEIDLLIFLEKNYNGRIRPRKGTKLSRKPIWEWRLEGHKAELFLIQILPFLQGRKLQKAIYALELRKRMRGNRLTVDLRGRAIPLNSLEIEKRDDLTKLLKAI